MDVELGHNLSDTLARTSPDTLGVRVLEEGQFLTVANTGSESPGWRDQTPAMFGKKEDNNA